MLSDKKYGLTVNILATRVLPVLTPHMVNTHLDNEAYSLVRSIIQDMFDFIDRLDLPYSARNMLLVQTAEN